MGLPQLSSTITEWYFGSCSRVTNLKRKELTEQSVETPEHTGIVDRLPLDQHIGVRAATRIGSSMPGNHSMGSGTIFCKIAGGNAVVAKPYFVRWFTSMVASAQVRARFPISVLCLGDIRS